MQKDADDRYASMEQSLTAQLDKERADRTIDKTIREMEARALIGLASRHRRVHPDTRTRLISSHAPLFPPSRLAQAKRYRDAVVKLERELTDLRISMRKPAKPCARIFVA